MGVFVVLLWGISEGGWRETLPWGMRYTWVTKDNFQVLKSTFVSMAVGRRIQNNGKPWIWTRYYMVWIITQFMTVAEFHRSAPPHISSLRSTVLAIAELLLLNQVLDEIPRNYYFENPSEVLLHLPPQNPLSGMYFRLEAPQPTKPQWQPYAATIATTAAVATLFSIRSISLKTERFRKKCSDCCKIERQKRKASSFYPNDLLRQKNQAQPNKQPNQWGRW